MRYLSLQEVISLHSLLIAKIGGSSGLRDRGALESAVAQPEASFSGQELYPDLASKAAALAHSLIQNHPFIDGNKRIGHGANDDEKIEALAEMICRAGEKSAAALFLLMGTIENSTDPKVLADVAKQTAFTRCGELSELLGSMS